MNSAGTPNHAGHDDTTYNTALRGAFLAFQKTAAKPAARSTPSPAPPPTHDATNGHTNGARSPGLSRQTTGNNTVPSRDRSLASPRQIPQRGHSPGGKRSLSPPAKSAMGDPRSPSLIAATLAVSRSASPGTKPSSSTHTNNHPAAREHRKGNMGDDSTASSAVDHDPATDSSSIGPTNALISLFERKADETETVKKSPAISSVRKGHGAGLRPMTPPRTMSPIVTYDSSPSKLASHSAWENAMLPSPSTGRDIVRAKSPLRDVQDAESPMSRSLSHPKKKPRPPTPPPKAVRRANTVILSPQPRQTSFHRVVTDSSDTGPSPDTPPLMNSTGQRQTRASRTTSPPLTSPAYEKASGVLVRRSSSSLSNDTFVSASSAPSPHTGSPRRRSPSHSAPGAPLPLVAPSAHAASAPSPSRPALMKSYSHIPLESLTNAIVAGSLASARVTPSTTQPPTPPPRKQTPHMRQTLRARRVKSEEAVPGVRSQHKKNPLGKLSSRKKHAHHEGTRHRWREEITARERQRYEGVWASNRGLLLDRLGGGAAGAGAGASSLQDSDASQLVVNVVARDIWARSRLPFDELAEVWDLVDTRGRGALDKPQFVVGMWLVDQRLRGRKIPRKVSDSVWGSAKGLRASGPGRRK
ncbi:hypothetical protein F4802DRAFT_602095 [Xylaria palmicola]|nr:hypothetical protein F4802DRAFT_602095 [Xylaria palmicola]